MTRIRLVFSLIELGDMDARMLEFGVGPVAGIYVFLVSKTTNI